MRLATIPGVRLGAAFSFWAGLRVITPREATYARFLLDVDAAAVDLTIDGVDVSIASTHARCGCSLAREGRCEVLRWTRSVRAVVDGCTVLVTQDQGFNVKVRAPTDDGVNMRAGIDARINYRGKLLWSVPTVLVDGQEVTAWHEETLLNSLPNGVDGGEAMEKMRRCAAVVRGLPWPLFIGP